MTFRPSTLPLSRRPLRLRAVKLALALVAAGLVAACGTPQLLPLADQPLSKETLQLLAKKNMTAEAPIFVRIFKEDSELEVWKQRDDGRFYHFKTYPICNWSGELGPKLKQGDKQAPEGFYSVAANQLNPNSSFHLAFNLGFPNAYDRALNRTGDFIMIHGKCRSAGCYAMTDALIEEIYALGRDAIKAGQKSIAVHAFPFRLTDSNMKRHASSPWLPFWSTLKEGYDHFEATRTPADVAVCERRYVVNVKLPQTRLDPERLCPVMERPPIVPFVAKPGDQQTAAERIISPGPKTRDVAIAGGGHPGAPISSPAMTGLGFQQRP